MARRLVRRRGAENAIFLDAFLVAIFPVGSPIVLIREVFDQDMRFSSRQSSLVGKCWVVVLCATITFAGQLVSLSFDCTFTVTSQFSSLSVGERLSLKLVSAVLLLQKYIADT